jgi:hypothetical protein
LDMAWIFWAGNWYHHFQEPADSWSLMTRQRTTERMLSEAGLFMYSAIWVCFTLVHRCLFARICLGYTSLISFECMFFGGLHAPSMHLWQVVVLFVWAPAPCCCWFVFACLCVTIRNSGWGICISSGCRVVLWSCVRCHFRLALYSGTSSLRISFAISTV